jgi:hypothetical protein
VIMQPELLGRRRESQTFTLSRSLGKPSQIPLPPKPNGSEGLMVKGQHRAIDESSDFQFQIARYHADGRWREQYPVRRCLDAARL